MNQCDLYGGGLPMNIWQNRYEQAQAQIVRLSRLTVGECCAETINSVMRIMNEIRWD